MDLVQGVVNEEEEGSVKLHHLPRAHPEDEGSGGCRGLCASFRDLVRMENAESGCVKYVCA